MFAVLGLQNGIQKAIENRTAVYFSRHHEFYKLLSILFIPEQALVSIKHVKYEIELK